MEVLFKKQPVSLKHQKTIPPGKMICEKQDRPGLIQSKFIEREGIEMPCNNPINVPVEKCDDQLFNHSIYQKLSNFSQNPSLGKGAEISTGSFFTGWTNCSLLA